MISNVVVIERKRDVNTCMYNVISISVYSLVSTIFFFLLSHILFSIALIAFESQSNEISVSIKGVYYENESLR